MALPGFDPAAQAGALRSTGMPATPAGNCISHFALVLMDSGYLERSARSVGKVPREV
jgi:hypothetical protein